VNNKVHTTTKILSFITNYGRKLRMRADIRRKERRESDRICIEEEERIRGGKSGIEKSTGRCEEASRWRTTESRELEEGQQSNTKYKRLGI